MENMIKQIARKLRGSMMVNLGPITFRFYYWRDRKPNMSWFLVFRTRGTPYLWIWRYQIALKVVRKYGNIANIYLGKDDNLKTWFCWKACVPNFLKCRNSILEIWELRKIENAKLRLIRNCYDILKFWICWIWDLLEFGNFETLEPRHHVGILVIWGFWPHGHMATLPYRHIATSLHSHRAKEPHSCIASKGGGLWPPQQRGGGLRPSHLCGILCG